MEKKHLYMCSGQSQLQSSLLDRTEVTLSYKKAFNFFFIQIVEEFCSRDGWRGIQLQVKEEGESWGNDTASCL